MYIVFILTTTMILIQLHTFFTRSLLNLVVIKVERRCCCLEKEDFNCKLIFGAPCIRKKDTGKKLDSTAHTITAKIT